MLERWDRQYHDRAVTTEQDVFMSEFASVLRSWRARVGPADVGMPAGGRRRAVGLRREELAALAGVSVDYIVRLEQGRATNPSPQLLGALAVALRLTDSERDHLYRVAGAAPPDRGLVPRHIGPGVQRIVDRLSDVPMAVFTATHDILLWNPLWAAVTGDPSRFVGMDRNLVWRYFTKASSTTTTMRRSSRAISLLTFDRRWAVTRTMTASRTSSRGCAPSPRSSSVGGVRRGSRSTGRAGRRSPTPRPAGSLWTATCLRRQAAICGSSSTR